MATEDELRMYAESLNPIFKEIFKEIARANPDRRRGEGAMMKNLTLIISEGHLFSDVPGACARMEEQGLVTINSKQFVIPTNKGEQIMSILN